MNYNITVNFVLKDGQESLMPLTKYVFGLETNPTIIEEDGTAILEFEADGLYFALQKLKTLAVSVTGAAARWNCADPYTYGKLTLNNPTEDVQVTIKVAVVTQPQEITRPFLIKKAFPVDTRLVLTKKEMLEIDDKTMPTTYFALCKDDGHFYLYNKSNEKNLETGKYLLIADIVEHNIKSIDGGEII